MRAIKKPSVYWNPGEEGAFCAGWHFGQGRLIPFRETGGDYSGNTMKDYPSAASSRGVKEHLEIILDYES